MYQTMIYIILVLALVSGCAREEDILRLDGLTADRKKRTIEIEAIATGIGKDELVEFFLIHEKSGHDYEAIAMSKATPSDIQRALLFIGMEAGRPVDSKKFAFWPKGERVILTIGGRRAEKYVVDRKTERHLPETGFVFTGSREIASKEDPSKEVLSADVRDPMAIASNYNEPESLFDVPRIAPQGTMYKIHLTNPKLIMKKGEELKVVIKPEQKMGKKRVLDVLLKIDARDGSSGSLPDLEFGMMDNIFDINGALKEFVQLAKSGRDSFVTLMFGDDVPLMAVKDVSVLLSGIDSENGIRIEPPLEGTIYYKGFIPAEHHRVREDRVSQPWELHLEKTKNGIAGRLIYIKQIWKDDTLTPDLQLTEYKVSSPEELQSRMEKNKTDIPAMLIYARNEMTHGELMRFIKPAFLTHPIMYVFLEE